MVQPQLELIVSDIAPLARDEQNDLERLETTIRSAFDEAGRALRTIRDDTRKLYRQWGTFDDYCQTRLGFQRAHAYRLIDTAAVIDVIKMSPIGDILPTNEAQARPLTRLKPNEQPIVWQEAVERSNGQPTAKIVEQVATERYPRETRSLIVAPPAKLAPLMSSASPEWYTPGDIIKRVTQVLGTIDLDPASSQEAQATIGAIHWCGLDHPNEERRDGLAREWPGSVYMNPPYGDVIGDWVARLIHQYDMGITTEAIALLPGRIDTAWFRPLWRHTFCAVHGRLKFSGAENSAPFPSIVVYFGENDEAFYQAFRDIGSIHLPIGINQWLKCK